MHFKYYYMYLGGGLYGWIQIFVIKVLPTPISFHLPPYPEL